jgi:queuosine precursor transporter
MNKKTLTLFVVYLSTIPLANWFINNVGSVKFPNAPHTIPVGFGYDAPSGVLLIGIALFVRDLLQEATNRKTVLIAIACGLPLSFMVGANVALASVVAFAFGELADFGIYDRLRKQSKNFAMIVSGIIGGVIDSMLFLWIAFGSITFWQGQVVGKTLMTVACVAALWGKNALSKRLPA